MDKSKITQDHRDAFEHIRSVVEIDVDYGWDEAIEKDDWKGCLYDRMVIHATSAVLEHLMKLGVLDLFLEKIRKERSPEEEDAREKLNDEVSEIIFALENEALAEAKAEASSEVSPE